VLNLHNQNLLPIERFTLRTCKNMTKTIVFTLEQLPKKAGGNVTMHAQHRIIYFCIICRGSTKVILGYVKNKLYSQAICLKK